MFGNPEPLDEWLRGEKVNPAEREHLIVMAGTCVPGFSRLSGHVEIFSHSPFSFRMEGEDIDRNGNSLVLHLTFFEGGEQFRCMLGADAEHETWASIVYITEQRGNTARLISDLFKISHHCSYSALSDDKGKDETVPREEVASLFERCERGCILVSSSDVIPEGDTKQPPHRQTAAYYRRIARERGSADNFIVTMEYPSRSRPRPLMVDVTARGFVVRRSLAAIGGATAVISRPSPRLG